MIKINGNKYHDYETKIVYGGYYTSIKGIQNEGISPYISFSINDTISVGIETICSKEFIKNMEINTSTDISRYITDILYNEGKGWMTFTDSKCLCTLVRKNGSVFEMHLSLNDSSESMELEIDTIIRL